MDFEALDDLDVMSPLLPVVLEQAVHGRDSTIVSGSVCALLLEFLDMVNGDVEVFLHFLNALPCRVAHICLPTSLAVAACIGEPAGGWLVLGE